jgi:hypothetical protein
MIEGLGGDLGNVGVLGVAAEIIPRGRQERSVFKTLDRRLIPGSTGGTLGTQFPKPHRDVPCWPARTYSAEMTLQQRLSKAARREQAERTNFWAPCR